MSTTIRTDVPTGFDELTRSEGGPTCQWSEGVCTETPTHYMTWLGTDEDDALVQVHCTRHHVLEMAELIELHLPECLGSLRDHLADWGEI